MGKLGQTWLSKNMSRSPLKLLCFFYKNLFCYLYKAKSNKINKKKKILCCNFRPFQNRNVQIWDHLFPILITKGSNSIKSLEVGEKKPKQSKPILFPLQGKQIKKKKICGDLYHFHPKMFKSQTASFHVFSPCILNL